ncbi:hypothetical protein K7640_16085 [Micromonospora sp. PLK6-60]|uniref:hypothetical protein n=1 Tax=Micromonospora sp. PLK6-60 TaxID=2873383 RepID=UPI001CA63879|nr:hypothetical protein [Micromonospora sp. PLK6-60]MBY8873354.1 hypothetical protein [Micromonospora sp. PLK6-60]
MSDPREPHHYDHESYDPLVEETEEERDRSAAARLFDIRRVIGGLFVAYGLIVGLIGLFDSPAQIDKAQGLRINLWAGLAMLIFGLIMLAWQWLSPNETPAPRHGEERP